MDQLNLASLPAFDPHKPVAIIGGGMMGTRVAWACATAGIPTRLYDALPGRADLAVREVAGWSEEAARRLCPTDTLADAVDGAQLAFENIPEDLAIKQAMLAELGALLPPDAFIGSNTSSLKCTPLAQASGRAGQFFNMNFSDPRRSTLVELMGCAQTRPETLDFARGWAGLLGMVVLNVHKEQLGYSHNRMWRVIKKEALRQIAEGIATAEDIDRGWMLGFGADIGPCGMMDRVGLATVLAIEEAYYQDSRDETDAPPALLRQMVADRQLGIKTGAGFYRYPEPSFMAPDFLATADRADPA